MVKYSRLPKKRENEKVNIDMMNLQADMKAINQNAVRSSYVCVWTDKSRGGERGGVLPQEAASGRYAVLLCSERTAVQEESGHAGAHAGIHTRSGLTSSTSPQSLLHSFMDQLHVTAVERTTHQLIHGI